MFDKVIGHAPVLSLFRKMFDEKTFEGVYLFKGPPSIGKYTTARSLARYLLCLGTPDDTCRCSNCRLFPNAPDYLEVSKGDDLIKGEDVRQIEDFISLVPYNAQRRVLLIDDIDKLYYSAAHGMLKILEELPASCVALLISSHPEDVPATITSRCVEMSFSPLTSSEIVEIIKRQGQRVERLEVLERMIPYMSGRVLNDFNKYYENHKQALDFVERIGKLQDDDIISIVKDIDSRDELLFFAEMLVFILDDMFKIKYDSPDVVFNVTKLDHLEELTTIWKDDLCLFALDKIGSALQVYRRGLWMKLKHVLLPALCWTRYMVHKEIEKKNYAEHNKKTY